MPDALELETERPERYLQRLAASDLGRAYKALVVAELGVRPGDTVLDLGCGPGADLPALARAVGPGGRVLGVDVDRAALAEAAAAAAGWPRVRLALGDVHHLPAADRSVDRVHTDRVLQHVADPGAVVAEIARVLRPGGRVALAEPDWGTLVLDHPDPALPDAFRRYVTERVVRQPRVGRRLPALCVQHGLDVPRVLPVTAVFRDAVQADHVLGLHRVTARAVDAGYLSAESAVAWLDHLRTQPVLASVTMFVTVAEAR